MMKIKKLPKKNSIKKALNAVFNDHIYLYDENDNAWYKGEKNTNGSYKLDLNHIFDYKHYHKDTDRNMNQSF